jgi:hypothetical protein
MEKDFASGWMLKGSDSFNLFREFSNSGVAGDASKIKAGGPLPLQHGLYVEEHGDCRANIIPLKFQISYDGKGLATGMNPRADYTIAQVNNNGNTYRIKQNCVGKGGVRGVGEFTWEATITIKNKKSFSITTDKVNGKVPSYKKVANTYNYCP